VEEILQPREILCSSIDKDYPQSVYCTRAQALDQELIEFGVSRRRWRILATLSAVEGITVSDLAKRAELDIAQTSRAVGTLAREGYLKRRQSKERAILAGYFDREGTQPLSLDVRPFLSSQSQPLKPVST
jgi:hypothetical protein